MPLAFHNEARYPDFDEAYSRYVSGARSRECVSGSEYRRIVREYCSILAERLVADGMVDLPCDLGMISAAKIKRKARYVGKRFVGYGKMDWRGGGLYDGSSDAFGLVFIPTRRKTDNLRCYGFVANRRLFRRMRDMYESGDASWAPMEFNDDMI